MIALSWLPLMELVAVAVLVLLYMWQKRKARGSAARRTQAITLLAARGAGDLAGEWLAIGECTGVAPETARRWWVEVAEFYGIAPEALRGTDRIEVELRDICYDPDNEIALAPFVMRQEKPFHQVLRSRLNTVRTWADLIAVLITAEHEGQTRAAE